MKFAAPEKSVVSEESEDFDASDAYEESVHMFSCSVAVSPGTWTWSWAYREAKGCQGQQLETVRCRGQMSDLSHDVMAYHLQRHKLCQQVCKS